MNSIKKFALAAGLAVASASAFAAGPSELCTATTTSVLAYTSCSGAFAGNINGNFGNELAEVAALAGSGFTYQGKSDDANAGPFTTNIGGASTNFTLTFDTPLSGSFVIGLMSANQHSFYYYQNAPLTSSITFSSTAGVAVNKRGIAQGLSHATLYTAAVPEPETYALMLAGLVGAGVVARRRKS